MPLTYCPAWKQAHSHGEKYDVIILDPPAFTKTRSTLWPAPPAAIRKSTCAP